MDVNSLKWKTQIRAPHIWSPHGTSSTGPQSASPLFNNCSVFSSAHVSPAAPSHQLGVKGRILWGEFGSPRQFPWNDQISCHSLSFATHGCQHSSFVFNSQPSPREGVDETMGSKSGRDIYTHTRVYIYIYIYSQWWLFVLILYGWTGRTCTVLLKHSAGFCTGKRSKKSQRNRTVGGRLQTQNNCLA